MCAPGTCGGTHTERAGEHGLPRAPASGERGANSAEPGSGERDPGSPGVRAAAPAPSRTGQTPLSPPLPERLGMASPGRRRVGAGSTRDASVLATRAPKLLPAGKALPAGPAHRRAAEPGTGPAGCAPPGTQRFPLIYLLIRLPSAVRALEPHRTRARRLLAARRLQLPEQGSERGFSLPRRDV